MEDYIYGRNNVVELLADGRRSVSKILFLKNMKENSKINQILDMARQRGIIFQFAAKEKFAKFGNISHQGVIAYVSPVKYKDFDKFLAEKNDKYRRIIITDGIEDTHNLGSVIRSAVCAGYNAVIFPARRNAGINAAVEKSSAGAVNHIDLIMVNSLSSAVIKLKDNDFWIIAADTKAKDNYYEIDYCDMNFAIVLGSEKNGISSTILKQADYKIKIPIINSFDSLNAANAASIIMYESVKQILQKSGNVV